ncbi:MAG: cysteine--tRNA ligase [Candidatus Methylomirabilales bacterium]
MALRIYNTLTQQKELFEPLHPGRVGIYACGITTYDVAHIGHARSALIFDVIWRYFEWLGWDVAYVRNFTDIDDKIINRAREQGRRWDEISDQYVQEFHRDMDRLGVKRPTVEPRATEHIADMIRLIETLVARGHAYPADGDVYFAVESFAEYGKLSHRRLEEMQAGARVDVDERKRHPMDFVLWKRAKAGEPFWESPWGLGRPGWHIECSTMSMRYLGETFDIHGGGEDLIFPHHENEIAQSECATGRPFARFWIHNGFVRVGADKMSKSLGNIFALREVLDRYPADAVRLFLLSTHYQSPLEFTEEKLEESAKALEKLGLLIDSEAGSAGPGEMAPTIATEALLNDLARLEAQFVEAIEDDFNTAKAIGFLFQAAGALRGHSGLSAPVPGERAVERFHGACAGWRRLAGILGLGSGASQRDLVAEEHLRAQVAALVDELDPRAQWSLQAALEKSVERLLELRAGARAERDWERADRIRDRLRDLGIEVEDRPQGSTWRRRGGGFRS